MITNVECIFSCEDFPEEEKIFLKPIRVKLSEILPIDIELSQHIWIHTEYNYLIIFDRTRYLNNIWNPMVDNLFWEGVIKNHQVPMLKHKGIDLFISLPYSILETCPEFLAKFHQNRAEYQIFIEIIREAIRNKNQYDELSSNNLSSETYYTLNGYTVAAGTKARDRMKVLYRLSDENNNNLSDDFAKYCWYIREHRSNKMQENANKRRDRDLKALKEYEETGNKMFEEDWGQ